MPKHTEEQLQRAREREREAIEKNMIIADQITQFTDIQLMILKEYAQASKVTTIEQSRGGKIKRTLHSNGNVRDRLRLDRATFYKNLKILYLKNCIEVSGEWSSYGLQEINKIIENKNDVHYYYEYGTCLDRYIMSDDHSLAITPHGVNIILEDMINKQKQLEETNRLLLNEIKQETKETNTRVNRFNENIVAILAILITAFTIIGVNLSTIPAVTSNFAINIITINASVIISITVLLLLLNWLIIKRN